ncbi:hypothetical protein N7537_008737 [Penicillium hordei]|uniref:Uncharacterized protein n=1 Tax=Penicillium hordei TaxID=40994 RepID=A0AAD6H1X7_9EURO|nr:uncharacterized protein N7537_008737 [Penicillium hordei]KAJ5598653.1 hypothetical protein N7537_008737 [Penicillium hordei]
MKSQNENERNNARLGPWRSPDSLRYQSGASLDSVRNSFFLPSSFGTGIQSSRCEPVVYESGSGCDPFQPAPPCYMGFSSCYWLYYIQHGVRHDVLTSQREEYPS